MHALTLTVNAQLTPYNSQDGIAPTRAAATDSLGSEAILVGIITSGTLELESIGIDTTIDGLDINRGLSPVWGYLYRNEDSTNYIGMIYLDWESRADSIVAIWDSDFDMNEKNWELDLTGEWVNSDAMIDQITSRTIYHRFLSEAVSPKVDEVTLEWYPSRGNRIPATMHIDAPLWLVTFNDEGNDEDGLFCFVASGTGETYCERRISSGVDDVTDGSGGLVALPNVVTDDAPVIVRMPATEGEGVSSLSLHDLSGELILDLTDRITSSRTDGAFECIVATTGLPSGAYLIRATANGTIRTTSMRIAR